MNTNLALVGIAVAFLCGAAVAWWLSRWRYRPAANLPAQSLASDPLLEVLSALNSTAIVLDADDEVLRASASAYAFNLVHDDRLCQSALTAVVARGRAAGQAQEADLTVARGRVPGAGHFFLHVRTVGIGRGRVLILVEDHSGQKRLEAMRRDFTVNISHELKTPVGAIALLAETIENNADEVEAVRGFASRLRKEAARLGTLVQEIIELTRLQEGDALVDPQIVDLDAVVAEAVDRVRVPAQSAQITLVSGGTKGLQVRGDGALITTAVRNLLDNAVRYSDPRTRVSVAVSVDGADPALVRIAVVDQGIGISKANQERIFERFYRVDKARSRATGGTGLGLSIVKHVAADHGGTVEVWSAPGRGSTFTLILPRFMPAGAAANASELPAAPASRGREN